MNKTILTVACILSLSTAVASAQSSQGNAGPGTMNNKSTTDGATTSGSMNNNSGMSTTGNGMSNSGMSGSKAMDRDGMAKNPSSQGNVGPGTTAGNPGNSK